MRIDHDPFAVLAQLLQLLVVLEQKALQQKWCIDPWPIEIGDKHPGLEVLGGDLLMHAGYGQPEKGALDELLYRVISND